MYNRFSWKIDDEILPDSPEFHSLVEQWPDYRVTVRMRIMEQRVQVGQQQVTSVHRVSCGYGNRVSIPTWILGLQW